MWLMNGSSISQASVLGNVPSNWSVVGQRDFNGDGNADMLWRDTGGNVGMWLMNGNTSHVIRRARQCADHSGPLPATGDFNSDGMGDILWRDNVRQCRHVVDERHVDLADGGCRQRADHLGRSPESDIHGDIFWRNSTTGEVGMWVMNGTAVAQTVDFGPVPLDWTIAGIGDFDRNGSDGHSVARHQRQCRRSGC